MMHIYNKVVRKTGKLLTPFTTIIFSPHWGIFYFLFFRNEELLTFLVQNRENDLFMLEQFFNEEKAEKNNKIFKKKYDHSIVLSKMFFIHEIHLTRKTKAHACRLF